MKFLQKAILLCGLCCSPCFATDMVGVKIAVMEINSDLLPNVVFIQLETSKPSYPACQTNQGWHFVLSLNDADGRNKYAMLLLAKATKTPVRLRGTGQCNVFSSVETADGVGLYP